MGWQFRSLSRVARNVDSPQYRMWLNEKWLKDRIGLQLNLANGGLVNGVTLKMGVVSCNSNLNVIILIPNRIFVFQFTYIGEFANGVLMVSPKINKLWCFIVLTLKGIDNRLAKVDHFNSYLSIIHCKYFDCRNRRHLSAIQIQKQFLVAFTYFCL